MIEIIAKSNTAIEVVESKFPLGQLNQTALLHITDEVVLENLVIDNNLDLLDNVGIDIKIKNPTQTTHINQVINWDFTDIEDVKVILAVPPITVVDYSDSIFV